MVSVRVVFCVIIYFAGIILAITDKHKDEITNPALPIISLIFWTALMFIMCFE
jgi:hypothetical protein